MTLNIFTQDFLQSYFKTMCTVKSDTLQIKLI